MAAEVAVAAPHRERFQAPGVAKIRVEQVAPDHFRVEAAGAGASSFVSLDAARWGAYNVARAEAHRLLALRRAQQAELEAVIHDLGSCDHFRLGLYRAADWGRGRRGDEGTEGRRGWLGG